MATLYNEFQMSAGFKPDTCNSS